MQHVCGKIYSSMLRTHEEMLRSLKHNHQQRKDFDRLDSISLCITQIVSNRS